MLLLLLAPLLALAAPRPFTDEDLRHLPREALLYAWSPHMNLSVRGLDEALESAKHGGPAVVAVLDPGANRVLAARIAREHGWAREVLRVDESPKLIAGGFRIHFPSYRFVRNGRIGPVIPGYKTGKELAWFRRSLP